VKSIFSVKLAGIVLDGEDELVTLGLCKNIMLAEIQLKFD